MPIQTGSFSKSGSPTVRIFVHGIMPGAKKEFDAIIDTGFTGFISMPMVQAFPLGLVLAGTTTIVLADNSTSVRLTAYGMAGVVGADAKAGVIILEWSQGDVLVGMGFLRNLNRALRVAPQAGSVTLVDDAPPPPAPPVLIVGPSVAPENPAPEGAPAATPPERRLRHHKARRKRREQGSP